MSNLVKSRNIVCDVNDRRIIDYNSVISEKITKIQETILENKRHAEKMGFVEGLNPKQVEELLEDEEYQKEQKAEDINVEEAAARAEQIIARANEDAIAIIQRAREESDIIRQDNAEIGRKEGYEEGKHQAESEYADLKKALEDEKVQMEIEYNERLNEMEPKLVDTILMVFERVTHVLGRDKKDLVLQLVNDVLSKTDISKGFLIRVSSDDYKFMIDNRERINGVVSNSVQIEIVEDPTLKPTQCMIESDSGIYDCSLDIQLENLISAIKTMACMVYD